jgi:hypothetical protein
MADVSTPEPRTLSPEQNRRMTDVAGMRRSAEASMVQVMYNTAHGALNDWRGDSAR